jgi:hypothetical protein
MSPENILIAILAAAGACVLIGTAFSFAGPCAGRYNFNDFPILAYQAEAARRFHAVSGGLWGYDPHFMAGWPLTFIWNSNVAVQWLAVRLPGVPAIGIVRGFFFSGLLLFPPVWWWTLRNFGLDRRQAAGSFLLGGVYFLIGMPALLFVVGMPAAGVATYLSLFAASFVYRYARDGGLWWLGVAVLAPLSLFIHKTTVIMLFVPVIFSFGLLASRREGKKTALLALAGAIAVTANLFWIRVALAFATHIRNAPEAPFWQNRDLLQPLKDYFTGSAAMNNVVFSGSYGTIHSLILLALGILGIAGIIKMWRAGERARAMFFLAPAAGLWFYSYYGAFLPGGATLNPTRYFAVAQLWLAVPAGIALAGRRESGAPRRAAGRAALAVVSILCIACMVYASSRLKTFDYMLELPVPPDVAELIENIKQLPQGGRIALEDSGVMDKQGGGQVYGKGQLPALFGVWTGREFIGGPYPYIFEDYHYASLQDGRAFGKPLADYRPEDLLKKLELYNVKWIVCWSGGCREYFRKFGGYYSRTAWLGKFEIFEVSGYNPTNFVKGSGNAEADYGKIEVSGAAPENGEIVMKYHWIPIYRTDPDLCVETYPVEGDPAGFIKVKNPPAHFVIYLP